MLIIYILVVGIAVGYVASLRRARFPSIAYISIAFLGALIGAFLSFGDAPLYLKYPILNTLTIPAAFSIVFALATMLADRGGIKKIIVPALVVIILIFGFIFLNSAPSEYSGLFREKLTFSGVERVGQPIEGFDAFMLKRAFPGFTDEDFAGVQTLEGHYEFANGVIQYKRDRGMPVTSAEQTVSSEGYATLLTNVSGRLNIEVVSEESIERIATLLSKDKAAPSDTSTGTSIICSPEQRNVDACIEIYQPVCAKVNIRCITTPCDPVEETFSNSCFACTNPLVESYTRGECLSE